MAVSGTSVFEMRRMVDESELGQPAERLIRPESVEEYPWRDYDKLSDAAENADCISDVARELDGNWNSCDQWLRAYGIDIGVERQQTTAHNLSQMDADVLEES